MTLICTTACRNASTTEFFGIFVNLLSFQPITKWQTSYSRLTYLITYRFLVETIACSLKPSHCSVAPVDCPTQLRSFRYVLVISPNHMLSFQKIKVEKEVKKLKSTDLEDPVTFRRSPTRRPYTTANPDSCKNRILRFLNDHSVKMVRQSSPI